MSDIKSLTPLEAVDKYFDMLIKSRFIEMFGTINLSEQKPEWKRIGDVGKILTGSTPKTNEPSYWDGNLKWIAPAELTTDSYIVHDTERKITEKGKNSCSLNLLKPGVVLLSSRAPIGKVAIVGDEMYCNQGFKNIECSSEVNNIFLYILLKNNTEFLNGLGRGATFKEISAKIVEDIRIPVPSIKDQEQFVSFFEQVNKSKAICKLIFESFDNLVKSRFIEMFGTPTGNEKRWPTEQLKKIAPAMQSDNVPTPDNNWLLNLDAIQSNSGDVLFKNRVAESELNGSIMSFNSDHVLYSKLRPYLNKVVLPDEPGYGTTELIPLLPDKSKLTRIYLAYLLRSDAFVSKFSSAVAGTKMPRVSMDVFWKFDVPLPPVELQNDFELFVKQVDKSKFEVVQSLTRLLESVKIAE